MSEDNDGLEKEGGNRGRRRGIWSAGRQIDIGRVNKKEIAIGNTH